MLISIAPDRRKIEVEYDEGAHERAVAWARRFVEAQVGLARELRVIDAKKAYVLHDCASLEEYGMRLGIAPRDARQLADLGHVLDRAATPELAALVADTSGAAACGSTSALVVGSAASGDGATAVDATAAAAAADLGARGADAGPESAARVPTVVPTVADVILAGGLSIQRGVAAGHLAADSDLLRDGEDPVALATSGSLRQVRTMIRVREEEAAQREEVVPLSLAVTVRARDAFRRARTVASEQAGTMLSEGETFSVLVASYLEVHDAVRTGDGTRRLPDTGRLPGRRYVPAEVKRAIGERSGNRCEVPGCPRVTFLELAHVDAHRAGGSREAANLTLVCGPHHVLQDAGRIRVAAWGADGRPNWTDRNGSPIEERPGFGGGAVWRAATAPAGASAWPTPAAAARAPP